MAILSFEELEQQIEKEVQEEPVLDNEESEVVPNTDLQAEAIERSEETLNAVVNLDSLIAQHDEALKAIEENKKSIEDIKQLLQDSMVSTNHIVKVLTNSPLKKLAEAKKQNITFESINNDPVSTLVSFNNLLKTIRSNISQEAVEEVTKGWLEKFSNLFRGIDIQYKRYKAMSSEMVKLIEANKSILEVKPGMELSSANSALVGTTVVDVAKNFAEFVDKYTLALKTPYKSVNMSLKYLKDFKDLNSGNSNLAPIGFDFGKSSEGRKLKLTCSTPELEELLNKGVRGENELKLSKVGLQDELVDPKHQLSFKSVDDLLKTLKSIDKTMEEHFKIVDKPIRANFGQKTDTTYGIIGLILGGHMTYDGLKGASASTYNRMKHGVTSTLKDTFLHSDPGSFKEVVNLSKKYASGGSISSIAGSLAVAGIGGLMIKGAINMFKSITRQLFSVAKSHMVWNDLVVVQREIVNMLQVKDSIEPSTAKKIQKELELVMEGKLK